jgi:hypothetical protein
MTREEIGGGSSFAASVSGIPNGQSTTEVFDWAFGGLPYRDGRMSTDEFGGLRARLLWMRLTRTVSFWSADPQLLGRAMTSLMSGIWHIGGVLGITASWTSSGLDLRLGALAGEDREVFQICRANLVGSVLERVDGVGAPAGRAWSNLWMSADWEAESGVPSPIDRMCELQGVRWQLEVLALPVPADFLRDRAAALARLAVGLAERRHRQIQLDPVTSAGYDDPAIAQLAGHIEHERERAELMLSSGALAIVARLNAADPASLASAAGAFSGASATAGGRWHALPSGDGREPIPACLATCEEAGDIACPPKRDTYGTPSTRFFALDEHPEPLQLSGPAVSIGATAKGALLRLPVAAIGNHVLVTGSTGSGKSSHLGHVLAQLHGLGIPFWVIEPVKNEYRSLDVPGLVVWSPGAPDPGPAWGLNPLEVPEGIAVATHLDRLVGLLRGSFGLPDPLPHLLELGLQRAYEQSGWDLISNRNVWGDREASWPTMGDVLDICVELPKELDYDAQIRGNLRAALRARLGGLLRGPRGSILETRRPFDVNEALAGPVVINLDAIGDDYARSFMMGVLLIRLVEARCAKPSPETVHVTVVEEAHHLMGSATGRPIDGSGDPVAHTASAFGDLLAEIRSAGEGVIVVEQSPTRLVKSAIVNTATKIALRTPTRADHEALGAAMSLSESDAGVFSTLSRHEALVMWEGMDAPVRARLGARRLTTGQPVRAGQTGAVRFSAHSDRVHSAASWLLRSTPQDHPTALSALHASVDEAMPALDPEARAAVTRDVVGSQVSALARSRHWPTATADAAVTAALGEPNSPAHPRVLLSDGRRPHLACCEVCPDGGCLTGELLEQQARLITAEGPSALTRLARDPEERRRRLSRRVLQVLSPDAPVELRQHALRCLHVQVFDEWADPATVGQLVASSNGSGDGGT